MTYRAFLVSLALATAPLAAAAQTVPVCEAISDSPLPANLAGWTSRSGLAAAADAGGLPVAILPVGTAINGRLLPVAQVKFASAPARSWDTATYAGLYRLTVAKAGDYQVSLSAGAWIDVVGDKGVVESVTHGHGPACTTLRKIVTFPLATGTYVVQLSGTKSADIVVMASPAE